MRKGMMVGMLAGLLAWSGPGVASPVEWLATGYRALDEEGRKTVQEEMRLTGLYEGAIDGVYDDETGEALAQVPVFLLTETADKIVVPLDGPEDGLRFVRELSQKAWSGFLYEGMGENAVH